MLALPFAFKSCGVVFGSLLVVLFYLLSWYTGRLILRCSEEPISAGTCYASLARSSFGSPRGEYLVHSATILFVLGACCGYLVIIGDILTPYINLLFPLDRRVVILIVGSLLCLPLSMLRQIRLLQYTSLASLLLIVYLVICIVAMCAIGLARGQLDVSKVTLFSLQPQFLSVLPIISFAFTYHNNVPLVWSEMTEYPTSSRAISISIGLSTTICCVLYLLCGIFGYLSFGETTSDNILTHFPIAVWYLDIGKVGYSLIIAFSYPLMTFPLRSSLDFLINSCILKNPSAPVSRNRSWLEAAIIFVVAYAIAILPIGIGVVFGITGAVGGNLIVTTLPCLFYIVLKVDPREQWDRERWWRYRLFAMDKWLPMLLLALSFVLIVTGLYSVIAFSFLDGFETSLQTD